jgi:hypothetical protein
MSATNEIGKVCGMSWQERDGSVTRLARRGFYVSSGVTKMSGEGWVGVDGTKLPVEERRRGTATMRLKHISPVCQISSLCHGLTSVPCFSESSLDSPAGLSH